MNGSNDPGKPKSLKVNALMNMIKVVSGLLFPLVTFPYTSRILGPDGTGKINFATSFVAYFVLIASIGIPLYGIREVAKVRDDKNALSALVQELLILHVSSCGFAVLAFLGFIAWNGTIRTEMVLFLVVGAAVPLSVLTMDWLYQGLEEYTYITIRSVLFSALSVVALFVFVHEPSDYIVAAGITIVATLGSSLLNFWNARKTIFVRPSKPLQFRRHLKPLLSGYSLSVIASVYVNLDTVMLGFMSTVRSVGYYASAMKLTKMLYAVVSSFGAVLLPRLAWYLANGKRDEFDLMLRKSLGFVLLLCLPITLALMLLSREILLVFAGAQYEAAASCLVVTAPVILFIGLTNIFGIQLLYPMGKEKDVVISVGVGAVVALILNAVLIPRFAHIGAAWSILFAECSVLLWQLHRLRGFYAVPWPWRSIAQFCLATALMSLMLFAIRWWIPEQILWVRLVLAVPLGIAVYFSVLRMAKEEFSAEMAVKIKSMLLRGR